MQIGNIDPVGDEPANVPFSKKYFLGGATSVRGWGRYEVSPLSDRACRSAATACWRSAASCARRLRGNLGGVLFLDGGNVWADVVGLSTSSDLRYAVGPGLRYQTPVGPIRFDVGYQLNPIPGLLVERRSRRSAGWRIHFSIGQAF